MKNALQLADHLSNALQEDRLFQRYRSSTDAREKSHWQVIWLKSRGKSTAAICDSTGYKAVWVRELIHRYNNEGPDGLRDRRRLHPGSAPMLDAAQQQELAKRLEQGTAPDGGPWTGPKVARWIEEKTGRDHVHNQRGWDYLIRLGFTAQTPRPRHQKASEKEQKAFKKGAVRSL